MEKEYQKTEVLEIDLREIFYLLLKRAGIIILCAVVAGLGAVAYSMFFITPQYESTTKMYVLNKQDRDILTNQDMQTSTLLTKDYAELIKSRSVTEAVIAQMNLNMTHETLLGKMSVQSLAETRIIYITVRDEDPYRASEIANAIRIEAAQHIQRVMDIEAVNVVEEANIPNTKCSPSISKNGMLAGLVGGFLAAAVVILIYLMNDTIKTPDDVERYLNMSVLGSIPIMDTDKKSRRSRHRRKG